METIWFEKKDKLELELGIVYDSSISKKTPIVNASLPENNEGYCLICYDMLSKSNQFSLSCKHTFCKGCWSEYLVKKLDSGFTGLDARCMQAGCNMKVGHSVFETFLASKPKMLEGYWKWLCKSYTDDNKCIKWCPVKGCQFCYEKNIYSIATDVKCDCGGSFCFLCGMESHKPADCECAQKWEEKNTAESSNL